MLSFVTLTSKTRKWPKDVIIIQPKQEPHTRFKPRKNTLVRVITDCTTSNKRCFCVDLEHCYYVTTHKHRRRNSGNEMHLHIQYRVANLAFLKPDFEILTFFNALGLFWKQKTKKTDKIWLFSGGKVWLWQNIVWAAYSLHISSDESLWPCSVQRILQRFYCCAENDRYI